MRSPTAFVLFLSWLGSACASGVAAEAKRWNVLLLVSDDQRPDTIAALGNPLIQTPHLDDLVRRGTVFTRATCGNPLSVTSRGSGRNRENRDDTNDAVGGPLPVWF